MSDKIKALSVRQPWAWAIIHGGKDIENRTWQAVNNGRMVPGRICIHASKGMTRDEYEGANDMMNRIGVKCPLPFALIRGGIIGTVTVTGIVKESESPWFFGPRGLVLADPEPCEPIPASGQLGYFNWTAGGELVEPVAWMKAWPYDARRKERAAPAVAPMPLFAD
jgi:hypothetical protein